MSRRIIEAAVVHDLAGGDAAFVSLPYQAGGETGAVLLPICKRASGQGPRVLVVGGTHGDEFEGQFAASSLARKLPGLELAGSITVLPRHHPAACEAGTRVSPIDGADLNRLYTGRSVEGASGAIAAFVSDRLLPHVDWLIDLHSGGATHEFVLSSNLQARVGSAEDRQLRPALRAFGAPYAILFDDTGSDTMPHLGTLEGAARALGVKCISSELGGGARLTRASAHAAENGLSGLLAYIGVLKPGGAPQLPPEPRYLRLDDPDHYCRAPVDGFVVAQAALGDAVRAGATVADLYPSDAFGAAPVPVLAQRDGIVVAVPTRALFRAGDMVLAIAEDA